MLGEFRGFIQHGNVVDMAVGVIIACCVFLLVNAVNQLRRPAAAAAAPPPESSAEAKLLTEIRDLLKRS